MLYIRTGFPIEYIILIDWSVEILSRVTSRELHQLLNKYPTKKKYVKKLLFIDINEERLEFAKKLGADSTHLIVQGQSGDQVAADVCAALQRRPTAALECSGAESSIKIGLRVSVDRN